MQGTAIPEELVAMEILSKLPVKSLLRFNCVSKHWASTFRTSHFITKHYNYNLHNNNLNLLLKRAYGEIRYGDPYFSALSTTQNNNNKFEIVEDIQLPFFKDFLMDPAIDGPCNGLLCLSDGGSGRGGIALWNPSTRHLKLIPKSTIPRLGPSSQSESDPPSHRYEYSFGCLGFGYDSTTDDYKIVRFVENTVELIVGEEDDPGLLIDTLLQVELYSLKTDSWKLISPPQEEYPHGRPLFNNYINGFYYWKALGEADYLIVSFDIANEKFSTLPWPYSGDEDLGFLDLLDFNGLLGVIAYPREGTHKSLDLWVLNHNNNNGSWTKHFRIEPIPGVERPLGFWTNGEIFLESLNHELMLFDPATRVVTNLGIDSNKRTTMQLIAYAESLVPINGRSEQEEHIIRHPPGYMRNQVQVDIGNKEKTS